jgi:small multidrug resistance family-3 protein
VRSHSDEHDNARHAAGHEAARAMRNRASVADRASATAGQRQASARLASNDPPMAIAQSLWYFVLAGLFEIGGGYLIWLWLREGKNLWYAVLGVVVLALYGVIPTLQPKSADFGRVYAAYGGVFIVLSILWGWRVDRVVPDRPDIVGGAVALIGAAVVMYWPR